jgi:hypothetical protein
MGYGRSCLESLVILAPAVVKMDRRMVTGIARDRTAHGGFASRDHASSTCES